MSLARRTSARVASGGPIGLPSPLRNAPYTQRQSMGRHEIDNELGQQPGAVAARSLGPPRVVAANGRGARDVEVRPGDAGHERLQKERADYGPGRISAQVLDVSDIGIEPFAIALVQGKLPG